ncbi:hypothetical protein LAZ67_10001670 [Cordylochernes scorpioides]|uniref:Mos1 transposase HTH domain-containing protein n=1 Tax=Cordylochernes scorpioides TaxID=51811 RepID=A0ABY6L0X8_9ARAC|nr:hypothetical protein LAZ67_10001670 [Cordylochernes scorpioides]
MEQKLKQRICREFCVKLQISPTETFEMLNKAFPNDAPKRTTVFEWHSRFKAGRISIEDDPRQGYPKFQRTDENQDTGISKTTVRRIVTEDLNLKKTPANFIARCLTNEQKLCRLATCEDMLKMTRTDPEWKDKIIISDKDGSMAMTLKPSVNLPSGEVRAKQNLGVDTLYAKFGILAGTFGIRSRTFILNLEMDRELELEHLKRKISVLRTSLTKYGKKAEQSDVKDKQIMEKRLHHKRKKHPEKTSPFAITGIVKLPKLILRDRLWRLYTIGIAYTPDDSIQKETEEYFDHTVTRDIKGVTRLPFLVFPKS